MHAMKLPRCIAAAACLRDATQTTGGLRCHESLLCKFVFKRSSLTLL